MRLLSIPLTAILGCTAACSDLEEFHADGEVAVFRGVVYGTESEMECDSVSPCSFIRRGLPVGTELSLSFDPSPTADPAGSLSTNDDRCGGATFDETSFQAIEPLARDHLSLYEFPGQGRIKNYIFVASPESGPFAGRDVYVFLSLMRGGSIEARLISGRGRECAADDCEAYQNGECDLFAVFALDKTSLGDE